MGLTPEAETPAEQPAEAPAEQPKEETKPAAEPEKDYKALYEAAMKREAARLADRPTPPPEEPARAAAPPKAEIPDFTDTEKFATPEDVQRGVEQLVRERDAAIEAQSQQSQTAAHEAALEEFKRREWARGTALLAEATQLSGVPEADAQNAVRAWQTTRATAYPGQGPINPIKDALIDGRDKFLAARVRAGQTVEGYETLPEFIGEQIRDQPFAQQVADLTPPTGSAGRVIQAIAVLPHPTLVMRHLKSDAGKALHERLLALPVGDPKNDEQQMALASEVYTALLTADAQLSAAASAQPSAPETMPQDRTAQPAPSNPEPVPIPVTPPPAASPPQVVQPMPAHAGVSPTPQVNIPVPDAVPDDLDGYFGISHGSAPGQNQTHLFDAAMRAATRQPGLSGRGFIPV